MIPSAQFVFLLLLSRSVELGGAGIDDSEEFRRGMDAWWVFLFFEYFVKKEDPDAMKFVLGEAVLAENRELLLQLYWQAMPLIRRRRDSYFALDLAQAFTLLGDEVPPNRLRSFLHDLLYSDFSPHVWGKLLKHLTARCPEPIFSWFEELIESIQRDNTMLCLRSPAYFYLCRGIGEFWNTERSETTERLRVFAIAIADLALAMHREHSSERRVAVAFVKTIAEGACSVLRGGGDPSPMVSWWRSFGVSAVSRRLRGVLRFTKCGFAQRVLPSWNPFVFL